MFSLVESLFLVTGTSIILFVMEVAAIVAKSEHRPSVYVRALARLTYNFFWGVANLLGIFADVFGFVRRFVLWLRDTFFRFIPREAILQAYHELRSAFKELVRAPLGFFRGLYDSVLAATLPWLSATILLLAFVVTPVVVEILLFMTGFETRPSTLLASWAVSGYNFFWAIGNFPSHFANLKALVLAIVEPLFARFFGWIPVEVVRNSTHNVLKESWSFVSAVRGLADGVKGIDGVETIAEKGYMILEFAHLFLLLFVMGLLYFLVDCLSWKFDAKMSSNKPEVSEESDDPSEEVAPLVQCGRRRRVDS